MGVFMEVEKVLKAETSLGFTGNWFIDAGILGFVNLMEEVYGWDLEKINKMVIKETEKVYYGYFPFAYLYKWLSNRNQTPNSELVKKVEKEIEKRSFKDKKELFYFVWHNFICKLFEDLWIEIKSKLIYRKDAYDKKNKLKKEYNFRNSSVYLQKIEKREKIINEMKNKCQEEIKKILKKRKKEELKKLNYEDLKKIMQHKNSDMSSNLKRFVKTLKQKHNEITEFLKNEWKKNVIKTQKFTNEESYFFRIPIDSGFYKNFLFFNYSKGNVEQRESFYNMISFNLDVEDSLEKIDKTINKLLQSEKEFSNINYAKFTTKLLKNQIKYLFVYLICFIYAFERYGNIGYVFFYSSDIEFSYKVNKRLKAFMKQLKNQKDFNLIFKVTWQQIINTLVEYKSSWSLENMYIISYQRLDNQSQENVEYIGIQKLQAQILLDDHIRNALNQRAIIHKAGKNTITKWILEEFIAGKPLYPLTFRHIKTCLSNDGVKVNYFIFHSLLLDASILEFKEKQNKEEHKSVLFSKAFLEENYRETVEQTKREFSIAYYYTTQDIPKCFDNDDERKRLAYLLLDALHGNDKARFLAILLKLLNTKKINTPALNWIFNKIINNNISWKEYCLLLIGGLVYKHE